MVLGLGLGLDLALGLHRAALVVQLGIQLPQLLFFLAEVADTPTIGTLRVRVRVCSFGRT